ncbi:hypothetical protein D3C80_1994920 [compost metagenome]
MAFFFQADIVIFRHAVETGYEMASIKQPFGNVKTDEARGAGNQITHDDYIPHPLVRLRPNRSAKTVLMKLRRRNRYWPLSELLSCGRPMPA